MANQLKMALIETIHTLRRRGWSQRRIARELDIDRETVGRYLRMAREAADSFLQCGATQKRLRREIEDEVESHPNVVCGLSALCSCWVPVGVPVGFLRCSVPRCHETARLLSLFEQEDTVTPGDFSFPVAATPAF